MSAVTNEDGDALFHIDPMPSWNVAAWHPGYTTEDRQDLLLGNETGNKTVCDMPLYKEALNFTVVGHIDGDVGAHIVDYYDARVAWYPHEIKLCCAEHAKRLENITAVLTWNNSILAIPPSSADLGVGIGDEGNVYAYSDEKDELTEEGEHRETLQLASHEGGFASSHETLQEYVQTGNTMHFGAITRDAAVNSNYSISINLRFKGSDTAIEFYN